MFTTVRPNLYESSDGFSIEVLGRTGLAYREGGREMFVDSEVLAGSAGMVVYRDSIVRWKPPYDGETLDDTARERILENIRQAFRFQGFEIDII